MITVSINGESREVMRGTTIGGLLKKLKIDARLVAVELNRKMIKRDFLDKITIKNRDNIEIVHFVGGGI